ncbi:hypothetical protein HDU85_005860 [Gaertneriomyces sp. JEL0708]|nr:hypothetical protein HDU85_005860 [Gaertneriomyces sp. JEL0708]
MAAERNANRPYDVVVWGATGFTGRLIAEYLAKNGPKDLKFAIAGRSKTKLDDVRQDLKSTTGKDLPMIIADSHDEESLDKMTKQAKVIITTVGPFLEHGEPLVASCVKNKTDYVDSTGEPPFIKNIIDKYHDQATKDETLIVPSCGFDSIPSDLGTLLAVEYFAKKNKKTKAVRMSVDDFAGTASGGTVASLLGVLQNTSYREQLKCFTDPYYLAPDSEGKGPDSARPTMFRWDPKYQTYWVMEATNSRYVRRSNGLLNNAYGPEFTYAESVAAPSFLSAGASTVGTMVAGAALLLPPVQWVAKWAAEKFIPQGSGPNKEAREAGYFVCKVVGEAEDGEKVLVTVKGVQDPGYGETSKMMAESGLALALERQKVGTKSAGVFGGQIKGGVATAATAMGDVLVERLRKAGMTFEVSKL